MGSFTGQRPELSPLLKYLVNRLYSALSITEGCCTGIESFADDTIESLEVVIESCAEAVFWLLPLQLKKNINRGRPNCSMWYFIRIKNETKILNGNRKS